MQGVKMAGGAEIGSAIAGIVGGLFDSGINLVNSIYNVQQNERNFDYQKALQQVIFQREDTAVQRRMADLKSAGLNPNLAAGSAAGAGAVVGRNNTPGLGLSGNPVGTALDMASAVSQIRAQREQNEILKNQKVESAAKAKMAENQVLLDNANLYQLLGMDMSLSYDEKHNKFHINPEIKFNPLDKNNPWSIYTSLAKDGGYGYYKDFNSSPLQSIFKYQFDNQKNSADLLQRDVDFYTADKIMDYFGAGVSAFSGIGSGLNSYGRFNKFYRR